MTESKIKPVSIEITPRGTDAVSRDMMSIFGELKLAAQTFYFDELGSESVDETGDLNLFGLAQLLLEKPEVRHLFSTFSEIDATLRFRRLDTNNFQYRKVPDSLQYREMPELSTIMKLLFMANDEEVEIIQKLIEDLDQNDPEYAQQLQDLFPIIINLRQSLAPGMLFDEE